MQAALATLDEGKIYGYFCEHYYGNNALKNAKEGQINQLLKGKDAQLFTSLAGIKTKKVLLQVIYQVEDNKDEYGKQISLIGSPAEVSSVRRGFMFDENWIDWDHVK